MIEQDSRWILMADLHDPREVGKVWPAGSCASVEGISLLKGGEVLLQNEETGDKRWATMEAFERALRTGAVAEAD